MNQIMIEENKLQHNIEIVKNRVSNNKNTNGNPVKIIAVLKGNAYGMGANLVAEKLLDNGIDFFAVTEVSEATKLKNEGFKNDILILNATNIKEDIIQIVENNFIASVGSIEQIKLLNEIVKEKNEVVRCHLKVDTGFCRFGFKTEDLLGNEIYFNELKTTLNECENLKIEGTYSHFRESYSEDGNTTREQYKKFLNVIEKLKIEKIETGMCHICNSSAFFKYDDMYLDAVRIGSAFSGRLQISNTTGLRRVGYLQSHICEIRNLKKGDKVGYSGTYEAKQDRVVAIVEAGYTDGVGVTGPKDSVRMIDKLRALKKVILSFVQDGTKYVEINEKKYPILGRVGMKNFVIDITGSDIKISDKVKIDINLILANQAIERVLES